MKDQVRLDRLRDMYKSKWYNTDNMSESDLWWIAYSRALQQIRNVK